MDTKIQTVGDAVREFLVHTVLARDVRVVGVSGDPERRTWRAEAEVLVPNLSVKSLGLPLTNEVLERQVYDIQLDENLNVTAYDWHEPTEQ